MLNTIYRSITILILCSLLACAKTASVPEGMENAGILPLSDSNPFLGTNAFLAAEMERSPYLYNFLKRRGAPTALEVRSQLPGSNPVVHLYYPAEGEFYSAEADVNPDYRQWILRGPYRLHWRDLRATRNILSSMVQEPVFFLYGKEQRFHERSQQQVRVLRPNVPKIAPKPKVVTKKDDSKNAETTRKTKTTKKKDGKESYVNDYDPLEFQPLNTDQQAILMARGYAERGINGDIIHTSKNDELSWESLAAWYTGTQKNADEILHYNPDLSKLDLVVGTRIRIPRKLIKEYRRMPENFAANPLAAAKEATQSK